MSPPKTKRDFMRRWLAGEFGNRTRVWFSPSELHEQLHRGLKLIDGTVVIRSLVPDSRICRYDILPNHVDSYWNDAISLGVRECDLFLNETMPARLVTLNAEATICQSHTRPGLNLRYSTLPAHMRDALRERQQHAHGLDANCILRSKMDAASYEELMEMLDRYDGAAIEFSCLRCCVGNIPHRNTLFWEIRNY